MEKKFEIDFSQPIDEREIESKIRAILKKSTGLSKALVFCYELQPSSVTEITDAMGKWQKYPIDRSTCYRHLKNLMTFGLINIESSERAMTRNSEIHLKIKKKYMKIMENIPDNFKRGFKHINFFYVTEYGEKFIEWSCKILGLGLSLQVPKTPEATIKDYRILNQKEYEVGGLK